MSRDLAVRHLALRMRPLNAALRAAVQRQVQAAARLARPDITHLCITDEQVHTLLGDADALFEGGDSTVPPAGPAEADRALEAALRADAVAAGTELPLDVLARRHQLSAFEQEALLLCAAPEIDRAYERIYGYVLDDMNRGHPCVELLCGLSAATLHERLSRRRVLGPFGTLRRTGMLRAWGEAASDLRQEIRLGAGMLDCLCGTGALEAFHDPAEVFLGEIPPPGIDSEQIACLGRGLRTRSLAIVGVWGPARAGHADAARGLALAAGKRLRRFVPGGDAPGGVRAALEAAAALDAVLWIPADAPAEDASGRLQEQLVAALSASDVPTVLTGATPWRPVPLLAVRAYAELHIAPPDYDARQRLWLQALPAAGPEQLADLAGRYRVGAAEVRAAALAARGAAGMAGAAHAAPGAAELGAACAAMLRPTIRRYVTVLEPRRGPADLILPPALHQQVLEIAAFFRAWPKVADRWGFGRLVSGHGGIKALFSGDSGTGKTLAAEVVAGELAMPLLKIDLGHIVSKWVGETEQHLESVFTEAEDSEGVLFFDEADALFGKRGEVHHGVDRYANLEVSYLLQRIESYPGLVILATNLKDNIDAAFTRRFHVTIQFPRPEPPERRRLWELAFPGGAPVEDGLDLDVLARLDLTGAGITAAARTAALMAAADGGSTISTRHIARAVARQYRREARVLLPGELGPYAVFAGDGG